MRELHGNQGLRGGVHGNDAASVASAIPIPSFGGKRSVVDVVWERFGSPRHYIEPFCGSAAILLGAKEPASLEVVNDVNGFIANFWRAVKYQSDEVARWADYPVSHIDLGARHRWLMERRDSFGAQLHDPEWPGDAQVAGWWLWGQCAWIGSGWCEWSGKIPHVSDAGQGVQAIGQIPHVGSAGQGVQAIGKIPHVSDAGRGVQAIGKIPHVSSAGQGVQADLPEMLTSGGRTALVWLRKLANRLERVRVTHGDWSRCLNSQYGADQTAVFLDPPYKAYEKLYGTDSKLVANECEAWAIANAGLRVALCGHAGDYDLPGWEEFAWSRAGNTYGGSGTKDSEIIMFSPACLRPVAKKQIDMFGGA